jgi:hypothetical protein
MGPARRANNGENPTPWRRVKILTRRENFKREFHYDVDGNLSIGKFEKFRVLKCIEGCR